MREPLENKLEGTNAPFTSDKLNELYWEKQMNTTEIAAYYTAFRTDGLRIRQSTVCKWLRKSNIRVRTMSEATALSLKNPSSAQKSHRLIFQEKSSNAARTSAKQKNAASKSIRKATRQAAKNKLARRITGTCDNGCKKTYNRTPSVYALTQHHFCSRACAASFRERERRLFNSTLRTATEQYEYQLKKDYRLTALKEK